jgi:hypothetical protein
MAENPGTMNDAEFAEWRKRLIQKCKDQQMRVCRGEIPLNQAAAELGMMPNELWQIANIDDDA